MSERTYITAVETHAQGLETQPVAGTTEAALAEETHHYLWDLANLVEALDELLTGPDRMIPTETVRAVVWDALNLDGAP